MSVLLRRRSYVGLAMVDAKGAGDLRIGIDDADIDQVELCVVRGGHET